MKEQEKRERFLRIVENVSNRAIDGDDVVDIAIEACEEIAAIMDPHGSLKRGDEILDELIEDLKRGQHVPHGNQWRL